MDSEKLIWIKKVLICGTVGGLIAGLICLTVFKFPSAIMAFAAPTMTVAALLYVCGRLTGRDEGFEAGKEEFTGTCLTIADLPTDEWLTSHLVRGSNDNQSVIACIGRKDEIKRRWYTFLRAHCHFAGVQYNEATVCRSHPHTGVSFQKSEPDSES